MSDADTRELVRRLLASSRSRRQAIERFVEALREREDGANVLGDLEAVTNDIKTRFLEDADQRASSSMRTSS